MKTWNNEWKPVKMNEHHTKIEEKHRKIHWQSPNTPFLFSYWGRKENVRKMMKNQGKVMENEENVKEVKENEWKTKEK